MPHDKDRFLTSQSPNRLRVRASLVGRGLQAIADLQKAPSPVTHPTIDYRLSIVVTLNTRWTVRAGPFPGKTYVMFGCDIENNSDSPQRLGKEMAMCRRSKINGEMFYIGDAILLAVSTELALPPQSATSLDLELEMDSLEDSSADPLSYLLCDRYDVLGYDYTSQTALLIVP
jgi:hypothetical protein